MMKHSTLKTRLGPLRRTLVKTCLAGTAVIAFSTISRGQQISVATWNIELFNRHFLAHELTTEKPSWLSKDSTLASDVVDELKSDNDKDNWEASQVILDPMFSPDALVIEEGCTQSNLDFFNKRWLEGKYETAICFATNTDREQHLDMLLKPGFKVLEKRADYYKEKDAVANERGQHLFARGPAFVLVQTPGGWKFWLGVNHQKSKYGNSVEVTQWRNREAVRTHQIIKELEKTGPGDVLFLGDMNDELGIQEFEMQGGGDTIANLVGPPADGITLLTRALAESGAISFGGYWRTEHRSMIDHAFATASMSRHVDKVEIFHDSFTDVASDHFPVLVHLKQ